MEKKQAFTLTEVIVAIAVFSTLTVSIISAVTVFLEYNSQSRDERQVLQNVHFILDTISREVRIANEHVVRLDNSGNDILEINIEGVEEVRYCYRYDSIQKFVEKTAIDLDNNSPLSCSSPSAKFIPLSRSETIKSITFTDKSISLQPSLGIKIVYNNPITGEETIETQVTKRILETRLLENSNLSLSPGSSEISQPTSLYIRENLGCVNEQGVVAPSDNDFCMASEISNNRKIEKLAGTSEGVYALTRDGLVYFIERDEILSAYNSSGPAVLNFPTRSRVIVNNGRALRNITDIKTDFQSKKALAIQEGPDGKRVYLIEPSSGTRLATLFELGAGECSSMRYIDIGGDFEDQEIYGYITMSNKVCHCNASSSCQVVPETISGNITISSISVGSQHIGWGYANGIFSLAGNNLTPGEHDSALCNRITEIDRELFQHGPIVRIYAVLYSSPPPFGSIIDVYATGNNTVLISDQGYLLTCTTENFRVGDGVPFSYRPGIKEIVFSGNTTEYTALIDTGEVYRINLPQEENIQYPFFNMAVENKAFMGKSPGNIGLVSITSSPSAANGDPSGGSIILGVGRDGDVYMWDPYYHLQGGGVLDEFNDIGEDEIGGQGILEDDVLYVRITPPKPQS